MNSVAADSGSFPHGVALLPLDLSPEQLANAPVLISIDMLIDDELTEDEFDSFLVAIEG
jgi:hypothetical protein